MITIWKYEIPIADNFSIEMPNHSKILSFQLQHNIPIIWCQVDTKLPLIKRKFRLCGTGQELENSHWKFIGTIQIHKGDLIFHLFEKTLQEDKN